MRLRNVDSYTDPGTGITYGLRGDPTDFFLSQKYAHDHVAEVTRALLTAGLASPEVSGFGYSLAGGLSLSVAAGQAFDDDGAFYETITDPEGQPTVVTLDQADATHPRIDLVHILLEPSVQAEALPRTFRRLRTPSELAANVDPYTPTNITRFAEEHARATVRVHKGVPGAVPAVPALNANEVALYQVTVPANAATLLAGHVTDVRQQARSLAQAWVQIDANTSKLNGVAAGAQVNVLESVSGTAPIVAGVLAGKNQAISITPASGAAAGSMSAADKSKLDGVAAGAQVNVLESVSGAGPISAAAVAGKNQVISIADATSAAAGAMPAADKAKLDAATAAATGNALAKRGASAEIAFGALALSGKVTSVNGITTVGLGVEVPVFEFASSQLFGNVGATTMYNAPSAGFYRVTVIIYCTANGSNNINLNVNWTMANGVAKTQPISLFVSSGQYSEKTFGIYVAANTAITYSVTGSTGDGGYTYQLLLTRLS